MLDVDAATPENTPPPEWNRPSITCGEDVLAVSPEQPLPLDTLAVTTPSGGLNLYYRAPDGVALRNTAGTLPGWKIDTCTPGGYVRPRRLIHGHPYTVVHGTDPVPLPAWLLTRLRPTPLPPPPTNQHSGTSVTELVYRKQIRPVVEDRAVTMDRLFPTRGEVTVNHDGRTDGDPRKLGEHDSRDVDPT